MNEDQALKAVEDLIKAPSARTLVSALVLLKPGDLDAVREAAGKLHFEQVDAHRIDGRVALVADAATKLSTNRGTPGSPDSIVAHLEQIIEATNDSRIRKMVEPVETVEDILRLGPDGTP
jgi:hypothetical protein